MRITCQCGKQFNDGLRLAKHRLYCRPWQVYKYHRTAGVKMKIPGTKNYRADVNKLTHNQL